MRPRRGSAAAGAAARGASGQQQRPTENNPTSRAEQAARPYRVTVVADDGRRIVIGSFPSRAIAERWTAEMLRDFAAWMGDDVVVEHVGGRR